MDGDVFGMEEVGGPRRWETETDGRRGLDNAGKTTIVKRIMGEDVTKVSPTLGFIIKTIDYEGCVYLFFPAYVPTAPHPTYVIRFPLLEMILTGCP